MRNNGQTKESDQSQQNDLPSWEIPTLGHLANAFPNEDERDLSERKGHSSKEEFAGNKVLAHRICNSMVVCS